MELHLDRELSNKRIFPALDFEKSGTRKEELLYHPEELNKIYALRRSLKGVPPTEAMEMFITRFEKPKTIRSFDGVWADELVTRFKTLQLDCLSHMNETDEFIIDAFKQQGLASDELIAEIMQKSKPNLKMRLAIKI